MSLLGTLGKVAMGVIVAKGVGKMLGGGKSSGGGLGGLLGGLTGGSQGGSGGGLGDLLGGLSGKSGGGGLGGILDSLGGGGLGSKLNDSMQNNNVSASSEEEDQARVMIKAMINAAKSDGQIDQDEQEKITKHLADASAEDIEFVKRELNSPLDTKGFINEVPRGMEEQIYFMSLLAIDLDTNEEAHYLDQLAKGLNISHDTCNQIHAKVGAPAIYS